MSSFMMSSSGGGFLSLSPYTPPSWARCLPNPPTHRFNLAQSPTPIHRWHVPGVPPGCELYIKRDDLTGASLSGNKVRKLEFLLADAVRSSADCVITIGGIQSNHCRATAVASRYLGLDSHLILRAPQNVADAGDPGLVGNLMVERMVGANVHLVTKREYAEHGSVALGEGLRRRLESEGKTPYVIPVGGSNALGTWGYVEFIDELSKQQLSSGSSPSSLSSEQREGQSTAATAATGGGGGGGGGGGSERERTEEIVDGGGMTDVVMACGSGGTSAGIALGALLCPEIFSDVRVHAYGVCDTPEYFYDFIEGILSDMGATPHVIRTSGGDEGDDDGDMDVRGGGGGDVDDTVQSSSRLRVEDMVTCHQAKGVGYAMATEEELRVTAKVAATTGVVLDPVYSGKALHGLLRDMCREVRWFSEIPVKEAAEPEAWAGRRVLFVHTGGTLGMFDKISQLQPLMETSSPSCRYRIEDLKLA